MPAAPADPTTPLTPPAPAAPGPAAARTAGAQWRRGWRLAVALGVAWLALGSRPVQAAQDGAVVLPASTLATELRAPLTQAVNQAVNAAHLLLIGAAELETVLHGETALRGCTTPSCLERLGRLLGASAVIRFSATAQTPGAAKSTYQLQVDYFQVEVGAQSASLTSTCASCTAAELGQSLRELTKQVIAADAVRPRGTLSIDTTPPSAAVFVDGNDSGLTPYQRPALVGTHTIILRATGYLAQQASISVTEARTSRMDVRLVAGTEGSAVGESAARPIYKKWSFKENFHSDGGSCLYRPGWQGEKVTKRKFSRETSGT